MKRDAVLSEDRRYRYALSRVWDESGEQVLFIGLNPSTADDHSDDPTVRRCVGFARSWGYGGIQVGNLFAFRATKPTELKQVADPVGPENDFWLKTLAEGVDVIIAAWGNSGSYRGRDRIVRGMLGELHCLKMNCSGQPAHPLYLPGTLRPCLLQG